MNKEGYSCCPSMLTIWKVVAYKTYVLSNKTIKIAGITIMATKNQKKNCSVSVILDIPGYYLHHKN